ncbi:MAG: hypothetical protein HC814_00705 [Rhodobacteraceae bacterium]|nr:hypothetical protein [Paracoccaceae bacterium]
MRVPFFVRWDGKITPGRDIDTIAAHIDVLPTLAEIAGAKLTGDVAKQVEGRSLVAQLKQPGAAWPDRTLVTHTGRWPHGEAAQSKFKNSSIRDSQFRLVNTPSYTTSRPTRARPPTSSRSIPTRSPNFAQPTTSGGPMCSRCW